MRRSWLYGHACSNSLCLSNPFHMLVAPYCLKKEVLNPGCFTLVKRTCQAETTQHRITLCLHTSSWLQNILSNDCIIGLMWIRQCQLARFASCTTLLTSYQQWINFLYFHTTLDVQQRRISPGLKVITSKAFSWYVGTESHFSIRLIGKPTCLWVKFGKWLSDKWRPQTPCPFWCFSWDTSMSPNKLNPLLLL